ncbi:MAG: hypothetical protein JNK05_10465 [Myxococcales bacterium]|nr:hypothetical protein [Myxococcales bacterium]
MSRLAARATMLIVCACVAAAPRSAHAIDDRPTIVSDAFYVGARAEPGWALSLGWDLDVYPTSDRAVSLGPGLAVMVLSSDPPSPRTPEVSVALDAVRAKIGLNASGGLFRPFALVGGGFQWTRFAQRIEAPVGGRDELFTGLFTVGAGADVWSRGKFGVTTMLVTRIRAFGSDRVPTASFEWCVGFRFGL